MRCKMLFFFAASFVYNSFSLNAAEYTYNYNNNCSKAYEYYMSLHFTEANAIIYEEIKANPYNLMATYLSDYDDCLLLLMNCNKVDYDQRKDHLDERIALLDKGDKNSPWYRFCKAGIYLHWALVRMRFDEKFKAATTFRKSYLLLKENEELFPDFEYNKVFFGLEETVVGTIPDNYKWIASIFGLKGNVRKGVGKLSGFINAHNNQDPLRLEAVVYYAYLKFYLLSQQPDVWNFLNSSEFSTHNDLLRTFVKSNIAVNYRKADAAIAILQSASLEKNYSKYPIFDYEMGSALLDKLDPSCINYFQRYLKENNSNIYIKDTWQKMALAYYLEANIPRASYCREQIKKGGNAQVDADKQAERFGESTVWPNNTLLQARLLLDGGYYNQALDKLNKINESSLKDIGDKLEYLFRLGRVYDEMGNENKALSYYQSAINVGKDRPEHFAARAALQMGFVYEHEGKMNDAISKYQECLNMHNHDFQSSIDQQAKAGINRLENK